MSQSMTSLPAWVEKIKLKLAAGRASDCYPGDEFVAVPRLIALYAGAKAVIEAHCEAHASYGKTLQDMMHATKALKEARAALLKLEAEDGEGWTGGQVSAEIIHGLSSNVDSSALCGVNRYDHDCVPFDDIGTFSMINCKTCIRLHLLYVRDLERQLRTVLKYRASGHGCCGRLRR